MDSYLNATDYSDEDYIDMEIFPQETIFYHSKSSPTHPNREFEFQKFSCSSEKDTTSSADELFYKGKLLPIHLPASPLQLVEKPLQNHGTYESKLDETDSFKESFSTPLFTTSSNRAIANITFQAFDISPVESCQVSRELHLDLSPQEYHIENSNYEAGENDHNRKNSWTKRLKLSSTLKASRAYLRSIFTVSGCSGKSTAAGLINANKSMVPKTEICEERHAIVALKAPFDRSQRGRHEIISSDVSRSFKKEDNVDNEMASHRRSFSSAIRRISSSKYTSSESSSGSSSTSSSYDSNGFQDMQFNKRSIGTNLEVENPIQAAIAHCKKSQKQFYSRKAITDIETCSFFASRIVNEDQERPGI